MGISDQSFDWLLGHDHVQSIEYTKQCGIGGCTEAVRVDVTVSWPPGAIEDSTDPEYNHYLPVPEGRGGQGGPLPPHGEGSITQDLRRHHGLL